jgi:hypothetical protein
MRHEKAYHTLADAKGLGKMQTQQMTKYDVLAAFAQTNALLSPDELRIRLRWRLDRRSVYSYLLRLALPSRYFQLHRNGNGSNGLTSRVQSSARSNNGAGRRDSLSARRQKRKD